MRCCTITQTARKVQGKAKDTYDALNTMTPKLFKKLAKGQTTLNERAADDPNQHARTQSAREDPISTRGPNQHARNRTSS